jgi:hypothetical protein
MLIASGVDVVAISRRLGHAKPSVTLKIYGHLFQKDDSAVAEARMAEVSIAAASSKRPGSGVNRLPICFVRSGRA